MAGPATACLRAGGRLEWLGSNVEAVTSVTYLITAYTVAGRRPAEFAVRLVQVIRTGATCWIEECACRSAAGFGTEAVLSSVAGPSGHLGPGCLAV